jgi:hypothetical protein
MSRWLRFLTVCLVLSWTIGVQAQTYLQLPLEQWGVCNVVVDTFRPS